MKALQIILICLASFVSTHAQTPIYQWAKSKPGNATCYARSVATDAAGNVYTAGTMQGTVDFDPGPGVFNLTSVGDTDICYIHSTDGKLVASKYFKGVKGGNQLEWNMRGLAAGKYYISSGSGGFSTQAVIKQ